MKRFPLLNIALPWLLAFLVGFVSLNARDYYVYVTAESEDEVALIRFDGLAGHVEKRIPVGVWPVEIEGAHGIAVSREGDYWYLSMAHGFPYGHVYKYSTGDDRMIGRVELDLFPATMGISKVTGLLYVVNFNLHGDHLPSTVSIIDPESMIEIDRVKTGIMPHGSRLSNDGLRHYSVAMMSAELYEIDALAFRINRRLYLGKEVMNRTEEKQSRASSKGKRHTRGMKPAMPKEKPTWVYPHPNDTHVYVTNNGTDEVVEVDLKRWIITRRFATGKGPYNCEVTRDGKKLVVTYKTDGATAIWDVETGREKARIKNTRKVTHGVAISPDSRYAFISVEGIGGEPGSVDIIDLDNLRMVHHVDVGKQAAGIAFWKMED